MNRQGFTQYHFVHQKPLKTMNVLAVSHRNVTKQNFRRSGAGFTIIELLVSITIFVFLTTVTVFAFRGAGYANSIRASGAILASGLRRAQGYALSGNAINVCADYAASIPRSCSPDANTCGGTTECISVVPPGGYGINVATDTATSFTLYANLDGDNAFSELHDLVVDTGLLDNKTLIKTIGSVSFTPPRAIPSLNSANQSGRVAYFCVGHSSFTGTTRKVIVNGVTGLIDDSSTTTCP